MEYLTMIDQVGQLHTERVVNDYFVIEGHLVSTRTADAYKAIDKASATTVCLWLLRHSLPINSDAVRRFIGRLKAMNQIDPPVCEMLSFGVDPIGTAFMIQPPLDGQAITAARVDVKEGDRRFTSTLRLIAKLHDSRIVCGDLCGASFIVEREGDIRFVGAMGSFDSEANSTAMMPPVETMPFMAPEYRSGGGIDAASDVFALGVLGYFLLTGHYPYGEASKGFAADYDLNRVRFVSELNPSAPSWADEVLLRALDPNPAQRFGSAGEMLEAARNVQKKGLTGERLPAKLAKSGSSKGADLNSLVTTAAAMSGAKNEQHVKSRQRVLTYAIFIGILMGAIAVVYSLKPTAEVKESKLKGELAAHMAAVGDSELGEAIGTLSQGHGSLTDKAAELQKLVSSDDPIAHDVLVKSAMEAGSLEERQLIERAIIDRARRLELVRSAEQVRQWLRTIRQGAVPESYEPILRSLDVTLPVDGRNATLRRAYASNPKLSLRLSVALALDSGKFADYQEVIAQLIGDSMSLENAKDYSALTLILAHPELSGLFGEDAIQKRSEIPDRDIEWLLKTLAQRGDPNVRSISSLSVERGLLPVLRRYFLGIIRDRTDLPAEVQEALVRASVGSVRAEDIHSIGSWYDLEGEMILLAILADIYDTDIYIETFDTLAAKSLTITPSKALVEWIRRSHWEERKLMAHAVGVLGSVDKVEVAAVEGVFVDFEKFVDDPDLITLLLEAENSMIVRMTVEKFPNALAVGDKLHLLGHSDKAVRLAALNALKAERDLGVLRLIIEFYEKEKDPELKELYKETFWMLRERGKEVNR